MHASTEVTTNVLCIADVEDIYAITYVPQVYFMLLLPSHEIHFKRLGKWFIAVWEETASVYATVSQKETMYTHVKVERAR